MGVLQSVFNVNTRIVNSFDARIEKNYRKAYKRVDAFDDYNTVVEAGAYYAGLSSSFFILCEGISERPFMIVRDSAELIAKKTNRPLDTSLKR